MGAVPGRRKHVGTVARWLTDCCRQIPGTTCLDAHCVSYRLYPDLSHHATLMLPSSPTIFKAMIFTVLVYVYVHALSMLAGTCTCACGADVAMHAGCVCVI